MIRNIEYKFARLVVESDKTTCPSTSVIDIALCWVSVVVSETVVCKDTIS